MTNSLRSCFDHDHNIMITIILLAFSVIGLIGLVIGNRFILIIFSASMTLVLIASITIYAIGKTEEDSMKPKVPYYTNLVPEQDAYERALGKSTAAKLGDTDSKLRSLVDKWLSKHNNVHNDLGRHKVARFSNKTRAIFVNQNQPKLKAPARRPNNLLVPTTTPSAAIMDDLSDEPTSVMRDITQDDALIDFPGRSTLSNQNKQQQTVSNQASVVNSAAGGGGGGTGEGKLSNLNSISMKKAPSESLIKHDLEEADLDDAVGERIENEQWVAYERYLYEKYLHIVSQSIDLIMLTILAAWMALLLDDESDQCFGQRNLSSGGRRSLSGSNRQASSAKDPPVYNYNGVRYSIRPDVDDSPSHIVVH